MYANSKFSAKRRSAMIQFVRIHEAAAHGPNRAYGYRDSQVFKSGSDQVDYQLEVVYMNGVREVLKRPIHELHYYSRATYLGKFESNVSVDVFSLVETPSPKCEGFFVS